VLEQRKELTLATMVVTLSLGHLLRLLAVALEAEQMELHSRLCLVVLVEAEVIFLEILLLALLELLVKVMLAVKVVDLQETTLAAVAAVLVLLDNQFLIPLLAVTVELV
jgi:hypothetical protein